MSSRRKPQRRPNLPPLSDPDRYLEQHLANELHWLLRAANEWIVQDRLRLSIDGYHCQVYAMDSAFLHARTLFEFFTSSQTGSNYYTVDQFGLMALDSPPYRTGWKSGLHEYLMHAQERENQRPLTDVKGTEKLLKMMAPDFAAEIVRVWEEFVDGLRSAGRDATADLAASILLEAQEQAARVLTSKMAAGL